jgi:hypothetical protein
MAGAGIGPGAAGDLMKTGLTGSIDSQNQALANLQRALNNPDKGTTINNNNGGTTPGGSPSDILRTLKTGDPASAAAAVAALVKRGWTQDDAAAAVKASLTGQGTNYTTNGQPYDPVTNPDGYHSAYHDQPTGGDGPPNVTDPGYVPGEPGYDTGGSTPPPDYNPTDGTAYTTDDYSWLLGDSP